MPRKNAENDYCIVKGLRLPYNKGIHVCHQRNAFNVTHQKWNLKSDVREDICELKFGLRARIRLHCKSLVLKWAIR